MADINADSGSAADIQDAVDLCGVGDRALVPAGHFDWNDEQVVIPTGVNVIGASNAGCKGYTYSWELYTATTILHDDVFSTNPMFLLDTDATDNRISGFQFERKPATSGAEEGGVAIETDCAKNFRIDHCTFLNWGGQAVFADADSGIWVTEKSYGVIDHCYVDNPYKWASPASWTWGYGLYSRGNVAPWDFEEVWDSDVTHFAGKYNYGPVGSTIMFVEDCILKYCRHATDGINGSWNIYRYNYASHNYPPYGMLETHGTAAGGYVSARGFEAYNNTVINGTGDLQQGGFRLRDGSCFIFDNDVTVSPQDLWSYFVTLDDSERGEDYPETYGSHMYVWDNTYTGCTFLNNPDGYIENTDYFLREPTLVLDGFTYTPYTYPHPLVGSESSSIPVLTRAYARMRQ